MITLFLVDVTSTEVPVQVHLEAFNPCIPLKSNDSAIPMIIFNYTVTNPADKPVKVRKYQEKFKSAHLASHY